MKVIVELDIHTVRIFWNFELGIFEFDLVANDAIRSDALVRSWISFLTE